MDPGSVSTAGGNDSRLTLISLRFRSLQGLTRVIIGVFMLFLALGPGWEHRSWRWMLPGTVSLGIALTERYYRRRFGRTEGGLSAVAEYIVLALLLVLAAAVDQAGVVRGMPSLVFLAIALYSFWIAYRDRPFRPWFLTMAIAAMASSLAGLGTAGEPRLTLWLRQSFLWMAGPMILTGWLDHRFLERNMFLRGGSGETEQS